MEILYTVHPEHLFGACSDIDLADVDQVASVVEYAGLVHDALAGALPEHGVTVRIARPDEARALRAARVTATEHDDSAGIAEFCETITSRIICDHAGDWLVRAT